MGWAWLPEILICKWCRQLWWCFPMPGSSSPGSVHTAQELLYKLRTATPSAEATKLQHRSSHCTACRVVTMPTTHPASKERNHPKRPLTPELSMAGAQAGQCTASTRSGSAELCCACRSAPQYGIVEFFDCLELLNQQNVSLISAWLKFYFSLVPLEPWSAEIKTTIMFCICMHA